MKKVIILEQSELQELNRLLRLINHDIGVVKQNKDDGKLVASYMEMLSISVGDAIKIIKEVR